MAEEWMDHYAQDEKHLEATEENPASVPGEKRDEPETRTKYTYSLISLTAYLLGVPKRIFENDHEPPQMDVFVRLEKNKNARIIRNLCILRTSIERNFKAINDRINYEYKSIMTVPDLIPEESIYQLSEDGIRFGGSRKSLVQHLVEINRYISDRINNCKELFPLWISWQYIRDIFIMPKGLTEAGTREAANLYYAKRSFYPYQVYMNWPASDQGNILFHDLKFVTLLYEWNHDKFTDLSKVSDVGNFTKSSIYDFLDDSKRTVIVVDCENSDPYKLCATLNNLSSDTLQKIVKIILFDDIHTASAWKILDTYTSIPVEHVMIERIKQSKSLVDIRLTAGACREFYQNDVDSFIIVSSDSDYWGLISSLPEAHFLVMVEHEKCGSDIKAALVNSGIFFCYIDDFYSGNSNGIKISALVREIYRYLDQTVRLNINEMLDAAFDSTRVVMSEAERQQFYNRFIKPMHLEIEENGDVVIKLQAR